MGDEGPAQTRHSLAGVSMIHDALMVGAGMLIGAILLIALVVGVMWE